MTWSHTGDVTGRVIPVNRIMIPPVGTADGNRAGCAMSDFPPEVNGQHRAGPARRLHLREKVVNARSAGAKAVLVFNEGQTGRTGPGSSATARFGSQTYPGMMAAGLSYAAGKDLYDAAQLGPVTVRLKTDVNLTQRIDYDVIAETPGGDPNRILMVGAHIDGVTAGPGINDDGSGTAMNLAIAHQLMQPGMTPKYKIRFGWFSGEEQGLFGSQFYVNTLNTLETSRILGMLDYDMIASTNYIPFVYIRRRDRPAARRRSSAACTSTTSSSGSNIDSTPYIFDNRSDYAGFRTRGVPATGLYTGAETVKTAAHVAAYGGQVGIQADPCYHEWCDTVFNLSEFGMNEFTDALAHAVWSFSAPGAIELPVRHGQLASDQPELVGARTASARLRTPSLRKIEEACCLTVLGESPRSRAITGLVAPAAKAYSTSRSRGETAGACGSRASAARAWPPIGPVVAQRERRDAAAAQLAARRRGSSCGSRRSGHHAGVGERAARRRSAATHGRPCRPSRTPARRMSTGSATSTRSGSAGSANGSCASASTPRRRAAWTAAARLGAPSLS